MKDHVLLWNENCFSQSEDNSHFSFVEDFVDGLLLSERIMGNLYVLF